jgi:hypothetical protein
MGGISGRPLARRALAALCGVALLAPLVTPALAAEPTRESYREAVEPICRANTRANKRILAGVKGEVRAGKLKPAAARFAKAAKALKKSVGELRAVPPPPADRSRLSRWLGEVATEASLFEAIAADLRKGQKAQAERIVTKLSTDANQANNMVLAFEFEYCRLEPSRFT